MLIIGDCNIETVSSFVLVDKSNLVQEFIGATVEYSLKWLSMGCGWSMPLRVAQTT